MKDYLNSLGLNVNSLSKESVESLLNSDEVKKNPHYEKIKEVLHLRKMLNKTSTKKYESMKRCMCDDERIRGLFQFYGANRTGRWAGRLVQVQNLPQNKINNLEKVREKIRNDIIKDFPSRKKEFNKNLNLNLYNNENLSSLLSQLIRTTFIPKKNHRFIIADFSAIEARIIAYLSNEKWRIDVFNTH